MADFKTKFGTGRQDWETPDAVFGPLNAEFRFTLDVCATAENAKCPRYYTVAENALAQPWEGVCWMNPPFFPNYNCWLITLLVVMQNKREHVQNISRPANSDPGCFH